MQRVFQRRFFSAYTNIITSTSGRVGLITLNRPSACRAAAIFPHTTRPLNTNPRARPALQRRLTR